MLHRVGAGNVLRGDVDAPTGRGIFGSVWPIEKALVLGVG